MRRKLSRESEVHRLYLIHLHEPWRIRRDGKLFKSWWISKAQTHRLAKAKARNSGRFIRPEESAVPQWFGVIRHEATVMMVRVAITAHGSAKITITKES